MSPRRTCSVDGCDRSHEARGFCNRHYLRWKLHGSPRDPRPSESERFWSKVDKAGSVPTIRPDLGPCWHWTAYVDRAGYGRFGVGRAMDMAHRVAHRLAIGPIPDGLEVDHLCFNRACVNPAHLEAVTHAVNSRRSSAGRVNAARQRAKKHCPRGHSYDEANTAYRRDGRRRCKSCDRDRARECRRAAAA